jgi:hypothetical protein
MALGSVAARNAVLDLSLSGASAPATLYLALFVDSGYTTEVTGGSYARVAIPKTSWAAASGGTKLNAVAIEFPTSTGAWTGTANYAALMSASTAGDRWDCGPLGAPVVVGGPGTTVTFPIGSVSISEA